jgi:NADH dehydrogenase
MSVSQSKRVVVVGGGFAGVNCAKALGNRRSGRVLLIDRRNHHLFQPLLYQVAMAGLSPAQIAVPIRTLLRRYQNVEVLQAEVTRIDPEERVVHTTRGDHPFDYLVLAAGAQHAYFGNERWEPFAPGLKTLEQATEIRRRVLDAYERAETEPDPVLRKACLTFAVVGGGPTGVELAGALGEMSRFTLARDFRNIDPKLARVILIEAGDRILPSFSPELASRATRDLERLGVQVWTGSRVTSVDADGVEVGQERISARTVLWAAGVQASPLGRCFGAALDRQGRVTVRADLSLEHHPNIFVAGDQARFVPEGGAEPLPGVATVALQQGRYIARTIAGDLAGKPRVPFRYFDKGQLATIGRSRAILESGRLHLAGSFAWWAWLLVHIYYLSGFQNRLVVLFQWAWSFVTFGRGARLIVEKSWRSYPDASSSPAPGVTPPAERSSSSSRGVRSVRRC